MFGAGAHRACSFKVASGQVSGLLWYQPTMIYRSDRPDYLQSSGSVAAKGLKHLPAYSLHCRRIIARSIFATSTRVAHCTMVTAARLRPVPPGFTTANYNRIIGARLCWLGPVSNTGIVLSACRDLPSEPKTDPNPTPPSR